MKAVLCLAFLVFCSITSNGQSDNYDLLQFRIVHKKDTIDFIKLNKDISTAKPTILFLQGSRPTPIILQLPDYGDFIAPLANIGHEKYLADYNFIFINPPHTPLSAPDSLLFNDYYVPDLNKPNELDPNYTEDNYLEHHVERANAVLKFLRKQPWVDKSRIILLGHSQGAYLAAHLGLSNKDVLGIGYFSGNPLGRFSQFILTERHKALTGKQSEEEAQKEIGYLTDVWKEMCRGKKQGWGDPAKTWRSFSKPGWELLSQVKPPVYVAYGTKDVGPSYCELFPIFFELNGKTNYVIRPFINRGHNFEVIREDGSRDYKQKGWETAFAEFISWCESLSGEIPKNQ